MTAPRAPANTGMAGQANYGAVTPPSPAVAVELWPYDPAWPAKEIEPGNRRDERITGKG